MDRQWIVALALALTGCGGIPVAGIDTSASPPAPEPARDATASLDQREARVVLMPTAAVHLEGNAKGANSRRVQPDPPPAPEEDNWEIIDLEGEGEEPAGWLVGHEGSREGRILLRFSIKEVIPPGAVVSSARLTLTATGYGANTLELRAGAASKPWEPGLAWAEQPEQVAETVVTSEVDVDDSLDGVELTALVQSWVSGERANHGVVIVGVRGPVASFKSYHGTETGRLDLGPRLEITYSAHP